jgi:hypothetical protein
MAPASTNVPDAIQQKLAMNPNSYVDLPQSLQRNESVALICIQNGVRAPLVVEEIMCQCPALRQNKVAWKLLIDSAVTPPVLAEFASEEITADRALMRKAILNCGPRVFTYVNSDLQDQTLALLTLERMCSADYRMEFENGQDLTREIEILLKHIFQHVPQLKESAEAWRLVVSSLSTHNCSFYFDLMYFDVDVAAIWEMAAPTILDNEEIMTMACQEISGDQLRFASDRLKRDDSLIRALIGLGDTDFMLHIPPDVFVEDPTLIVDFLTNDGNTGTVLDILPTELWKNRCIVETYLRMGGLPHDAMGENAGQDRNYCLAFIEGSTKERRRPLTSWICADLRNDPAFLVEATKLNKWILLYAHSEIKRNPFELLLVTAAYHGAQPLRTILMMPQQRVGNAEDDHIDVLHFAQQVRQALTAQAAFWIFMCAIFVDKPNCCLSMLNLGPDSLVVECIATYVGVPRGETLKLLRIASPVVEELLRDPEGSQFLATMGREYYFERRHLVL